MFLGWYDPSEDVRARLKVQAAIDRYIEKFGHAPATCLTIATDAAELHDDSQAPQIIVRSVDYLHRFTFYVGFEDQAEIDPLTA